MVSRDSFQSLIALLSNILEAHTAALFLYDPQNKELQLIASQSTSKFLRERIALPLDQSGILSQVYKQGQPLHMGKVALENVEAALPFYRDGESGIKALFAAPVAKTRGLVYVDSKRVWGFPDQQQKWVVEMAGVLHSLLEQEFSLIQRDEYSHILELWHQLAEAAVVQKDERELARLTVEHCSAFLDADYCFLASREGRDPHYRLIAASSNAPPAYLQQCFMLESGLLGWIFRNTKSLLIQKMNPESKDHFVLAATENLPHAGSFWGLHAPVFPGVELVLAFLARDEKRWTGDMRHAVGKGAQFFMLAYSRLLWQFRCQQAENLDPLTGLHNGLAFENAVSDQLMNSLQASEPFTLVLVQFEPWQLCFCKVSLAEGRRWQQRIGEDLERALPDGTFIAQLSEGRFGMLFPGSGEADVERCCAAVGLFRRSFEPARKRGIKLRPYMGWASFPQHGTRLEELWTRAYQSLWQDFQRLRHR